METPVKAYGRLHNAGSSGKLSSAASGMVKFAFESTIARSNYSSGLVLFFPTSSVYALQNINSDAELQ